MRRATRSRSSSTATQRSGAGEGFEVAVRAAGSILQAHLRRGRRCALVVNSAARESQPVTSEGEWRRALEVLAGGGAERAHACVRAPAGRRRHRRALARARRRHVARRRRARRPARAARALAARRLARLRRDDARPEPQLLRLQAAGIPVAVVRPGDDLAGALARQREARVA